MRRLLLAGALAAAVTSGALGCRRDGTSLRVTSPAFNDGDAIPRQYTCDGENAPPPLNLSGAPPNARSLALVVEDPDAPGGVFTHWLVWNLPAQPHGVVGTEGTNDFGKRGYGGPCPPQGAAHRYVVRLFALDAPLSLPDGARRGELDAAMRGHAVAEARFSGKYAR